VQSKNETASATGQHQKGETAKGEKKHNPCKKKRSREFKKFRRNVGGGCKGGGRWWGYGVIHGDVGPSTKARKRRHL